jgi:hypothetical protein
MDMEEMKPPPESLLTPEFVAEKSLHALLQNYTGQIVNVKKHCPC